MIINIKEGFRFNGKHSKDFGMRLKSRSAPTPEEKSIIEDLPFVQGVYDFSMMLGDRIFNNRPIKYQFETYEREYGNRKVAETVIKNWLMRKGIQPLYDDHDRGFHYLAKCTDVSVEDDHQGGRLLIEITFDAYPFMISDLPEGNDVWDTFNFELDVSQLVSTQSSMGVFKELLIGSYATIGAYATAFDGWSSISSNFIGVSRKILSKVSTTQGNSNWAYQLEGITGNVLEQDIVQSRVNPTKINLLNVGSTSIVPTVVTNNKISIVKGNTVYNFFPGRSKSEMFRLDVGENHLEITSIYDTDIEFEFHKELI